MTLKNGGIGGVAAGADLGFPVFFGRPKIRYNISRLADLTNGKKVKST